MKKKTYILLTLLLLPSVLACKKLPAGPEDIPDTSYVPRTELGKQVALAASVGHVYADTTFMIAAGVDETDIHLQTSLAKVEHVFILRIKLNTPGVKMKVGMPYDLDSYVIGSRQTPSDMIEYVDVSQKSAFTTATTRRPGLSTYSIMSEGVWRLPIT